MCPITGDLLVCSYDNYLYCFHPPPPVCHSVNSNSKKMDNAPQIKYKINTGACFGEALCDSKGSCVIVASIVGVVTCVHSTTGDIIWRRDLLAPVFTSPLLINDEDSVCIGDVRGTMYSLRCIDGTILWRTSISPSPIFSSPTLYEDSLYAGSNDGCLYKVNSSNGSVSWSQRISSSSIVASPFILYTKNWTSIVTTSSSGDLALVDAHSGRVTSSRKLQLQVFSSPICDENIVMFGTRNDQLVCFAVS